MAVIPCFAELLYETPSELAPPQAGYGIASEVVSELVAFSRFTKGERAIA